MLQGLEAAVRRYEEIAAMLEQPGVAGDLPRYRALMKEYKELTPLMEKYAEYKAQTQAQQEARELLESGSADRLLREMANEQLAESAEKAETLEQELKMLLLPHDPNDERSVILEIRAGTGGEEAALFAADLYRMYTMYATARGWRYEMMSSNETELGGCKEVILSIEGDSVYSRLKYESGVHRVQRVPVTDSQGKIQTSAVTVAVLPEADEVELDLNAKDLKIDTYRSSGAGGQHINKTESAIRITHLPTGLVVECQDERSQYKNKDKAMKVLRSRLLERMQAEQEATIAAERRSQVGSGDRSGRIRTYNFPQGRITDHRINLTVYQIDSVMNGNLDLLTDALIAEDQAKKLSAGSVIS